MISNNNYHDDLKLGQFKVKLKIVASPSNTFEEHIVSQLSQEELAEGWRLVLPKAYKSSTIHHFNVYLTQLPPHLWSRLRVRHSLNDTNYYITCRDQVYHYTIKSSKYDEQILVLYTEVMRRNPNVKLVSEIYNSLNKHSIRGWLMTRAKYIIGKNA